MGVATSNRASLITRARSGVLDFALAPLSSNEKVPRGRDDMSSVFTGTNRRTTSVSTTPAATRFTTAKARNCTRSPSTMPAAAHMAGGNADASWVVS